MKSTLIKHFIWFFFNSSYDELKATCYELGGENELLGNHLWEKMENFLKTTGKHGAACGFFAAVDSELQEKLCEIIEKKYT